MATTRERLWRRCLRLSVTGLMFLVLAVGCCLGWWVHLAHAQRHAVAAILAAGGRVYYDTDLPFDHDIAWWNLWLAKHVDIDLVSSIVEAELYQGCGEAELAQVGQLDRLESLSLLGANVTDADMAYLGKLTRLRSLYLENLPITDASLVHVESMPGLEVLSLERTPVSDAGLVHLKGLANLRILRLASTQVGDAGLSSLESLASLKELSLDRTRVGDAGLAYLSRLTGLRNLGLDRTWVTDAGLVHLAGMTSLESLSLFGTQVSGPGLAHLRPLVGLTNLHLNRTPVNDEGLLHLAPLIGLRNLGLSDTRITDAGLAHLAGLTGLEYLSIIGTRVSDGGLRHLEKLARLSALYACDARVTPAGESQIRKALPNLSVMISRPDWWDSAARGVQPPTNRSDGDDRSGDRLFKPDGSPVYVNIYSTDPNADQKALLGCTNDIVLPRLLRVRGVDAPRNLAEDVFAIRIRLNPDRLQANEVSSGDVMKALAVSTMDADLARATKAGRVNEDEQIHASPRFSKLEQFAEIILRASPEGDILRVQDVGQVEEIFPYFDVFSDVDGHRAATIIIKPLPGRSAAIAAEAIAKELKGAPLPPGMDYEVIPIDSRNLIYAVMKAPPDLTLEYVSDRCQDLAAIARGIEGVASVSSLSGYEIRTEDRDWDLGTCLIRLKDRSGRKLTSRQIVDALGEKSRTMNVHLSFFEAPAVSVFVATSGFSVRLLDRANSNDEVQLGSSSEGLMDDMLKRKNLKGLFTYLAGHYPGYELVIDNDAAKQEGLAIADALEHLLAIMGGDTQAVGTLERVAEDFRHRFVKNERGGMTRYSSFLRLKKKPAVDASRR